MLGSPPIDEAPPEAVHEAAEAPAERPHLRVVREAAPRRVPPRSLEAEELIVGALLLDSRLLAHLDGELDAGDFYHADLRAIYEAIQERHKLKRAIDPLLVHEHMMEVGSAVKLLARGGLGYLSGLANAAVVSQPEVIAEHGRLIHRKAVSRQLIDTAQTLVQQGYLDPDIADVTARAHEKLAALSQAAAPRSKVALFDKDAFLKDCLSALARPISPKLPFGVTALDEALGGGFPAGAVIVLAAPPKYFKTAVLISLVCRWARAGQRVVYVTGENTAQEIYARLCSHEQFGKSNKFHSTIKHDGPQYAEEHRATIAWMAGFVRVVSLPDEEIKEPRGLTWPELLRQCDREAEPPLVIVDYVEEFADRLPRHDGTTEQAANKAVLRMLKNYACRRQARVLAVCSVGRGTYNNNAESVFNNPEACPEDFKAVAKHSGYIDFAASALLALQFGSRDLTTDPESGHTCVSMKMHLAMAREGPGPVTVPMLAFGGFCRFIEDTRQDTYEEEALPPGIPGDILKELGKPDNRNGQTGDTIARLIHRRPPIVKTHLREMARSGQLHSFSRGQAILFVHPRYRTDPEQTAFPALGKDPPN